LPESWLTTHVCTTILSPLTSHLHDNLHTAHLSTPPIPLPPRKKAAGKLDMASLIKRPEEIYETESAWVGAGAADEAEALQRVLAYASETLLSLDQHAREGPKGEQEDQSEEESEEMKKLRLNLLGLAKRAPLDRIGRIPRDKVPVGIRGFVPVK
jgi:hypothetical protein